MDNNNALLERLEKVIDTLSDNSIKMGQMLAVHDEKLEKQDRIDAVLFEKIKQVDEKLDLSLNTTYPADHNVPVYHGGSRII